MKITKIESIPISIPLRKPYVISRGPILTLDHIVTKVYTDENIIGFGEAAPLPIFSDETQEDIKIIIDNYLAPVVIGEDPFDMEKLLEKMDKSITGHTFAKAAIECALWDIMGKSVKKPVYKLLGGLYRDKIPVVWAVGLGNPSEMAEEAKKYVEMGFTTIKIKIGINPKKDLERVAAVRSAIGDGPSVRVDANQGYTADVAIKICRKMEKYDLELIEQPVPRHDLNGMAAVARALDTPIMADESVFTPEDAIQVVRKEAAGIINIKIMKSGGLYNSKKIAAIAESAGIPCIVGSMIEMGIGTVAGAHFACAIKIIRYPCELIGNMLLEDDILKEQYVGEKGFLRIPQGHGLGIEVKEDGIDKYKRTLD